MKTPKWENALLVLLTLAVLGIVEYHIYNLGILKRELATVSFFQDEIVWTSEIEGVNLADAFRTDSSGLSRISETKGVGRAKFIVIISDSSCKPCFGNHVKEYVIGLKQNNCLIDPTQWMGIYVGKNTALGESTFRGVFGAKAGYVNVSSIDQRFRKGDDGVILFATSDNTILACSMISKVTEGMKSYFVKRATNALRETEITSHL